MSILSGTQARARIAKFSVEWPGLSSVGRTLLVSSLGIVGISAPAFAQEVAAPQSPGSGFSSTLMLMVVLFGVMWLFMILPGQRREKERKAMLAALGKGDEVVTNSGILGTIVGVKDKTVVLKVSDDPVTKMEFLRAAISQVSAKQGEKDAKETK